MRAKTRHLPIARCILAALALGLVACTSPAIPAEQTAAVTAPVASPNPTATVHTAALSIGTATPTVPISGTAIVSSATPPASPTPGTSAVAPGTAFTVSTVLDPASPVRFGTAAPGARFIAVDVAIANTGITPQPYDVLYLMLDDTAGNRYPAARDVDTDVLLLGAGTTAPGTVSHGWVVFAVPVTAQRARVTYTPPGATPIAIGIAS